MKVLIVLFGWALFLGGCAHSTMRGTVAMKVSDSEAHVCMNKDEVSPGDRVILFKSTCTKGGAKDSSPSCAKVEIGGGVVTKNINDHYAKVKFEDGVTFEEGSFVEKISK